MVTKLIYIKKVKLKQAHNSYYSFLQTFQEIQYPMNLESKIDQNLKLLNQMQQNLQNKLLKTLKSIKQETLKRATDARCQYFLKLRQIYSNKIFQNLKQLKSQIKTLI